MFTAAKDDTISSLKNATPSYQNTNEVKADLREVAGKAGHKMREFIDSASDEISHAKDTVTTQIRTNPVQSSLIALGAGFLLGTLFRR